MAEWSESEVAGFMAKSEVFAVLPDEVREDLSRKARVKSYETDQTIIRRGDTGRSLFIVASGKVAVSLESPKGVEEVSVLEPGDFFGEIAMMTRARRTATVTTRQAATLLEFESDAILDLANEYPDFKSRIARTGVARSQASLKKLIED